MTYDLATHAGSRAILGFAGNGMIMDVEATYQQAFQLRCEGQYAEAKTLLEGVIKVDPNHDRAMHQLALIWGFEGDFDRSLTGLKFLLGRSPNNLDVKYDLAMTTMMLGDYDEGCKMLREILSVDPNHEKALQQSAYC